MVGGGLAGIDNRAFFALLYGGQTLWKEGRFGLPNSQQPVQYQVSQLPGYLSGSGVVL